MSIAKCPTALPGHLRSGCQEPVQRFTSPKGKAASLRSQPLFLADGLRRRLVVFFAARLRWVFLAATPRLDLATGRLRLARELELDLRAAMVSFPPQRGRGPAWTVKFVAQTPIYATFVLLNLTIWITIIP